MYFLNFKQIDKNNNGSLKTLLSIFINGFDTRLSYLILKMFSQYKTSHCKDP